ncbi:uncharacterized protein METZ01_LOCUS381201, partial [marine metagenome]
MSDTGSRRGGGHSPAGDDGDPP